MHLIFFIGGVKRPLESSSIDTPLIFRRSSGGLALELRRGWNQDFLILRLFLKIRRLEQTDHFALAGRPRLTVLF